MRAACQLAADSLTTAGHPARTPVAGLLAGCAPAVAQRLPQVRPGAGRGGAVPVVTRAGHIGGHGGAGQRAGDENDAAVPGG
jgi:hypothetical protein